MHTKNDMTKPDTELKEETGEGCPVAPCSAFFYLDAPRLRELLEDYVRDKRQIGKDLGLPEEERLHHRFQRRIICDLQRENRMMKMALVKVHERMQGPANNRRFMQIAGPARECLNLAKPFLPNTTTQAAPFAKVFAPSEKGWSMVIGESVTYFNSMQEAIAAAEAHNKQRK
jgi:hypothetical protein